MKKRSQRKDTRRIFEEEGPSTSYQQKRKLKNHRSPHISVVATSFEEGESYVNEEIREPETHETLNLYLEEYKEQSRDFKESLTLQEIF